MYDHLIKQLKKHPYRFSFFQAVYLLEQNNPASDRVGAFGKPEAETVRLGNVDSLSFPPNQIQSISESGIEDHDSYLLRTTLSGLFGVLSPLPTCYTASIVSFQDEGKEERHRLRDFLDIFNHRLLSLLSRTDSYRHIHRTGSKDSAEPFADTIFSILALSNPELRSTLGKDMFGSLASCRLLGFGSRSSAGLKAWLKKHFRFTPFAIREFSPYWVSIPNADRALLGQQNCRLGGSDSGDAATIGEWMLDRETKFRVEVGPVLWEEFQRLLPNGKDFDKLKRLVTVYVPDWLRFDFQVKLLGRECRHLKVVLDGSTSRLGFTAGLFTENGQDTPLSLVLEVHYG